MASPASPPPPAGPNERARQISSMLVSRIGERLESDAEDRSVLLEREFLNEGVALGDVENSLERLELNLRTWLRLREPKFPCLVDEDGIVPIDMLNLYPSLKVRHVDAFLPDALRPLLEFFTEPFRREWESEIDLEPVGIADVLYAVEPRLTKFLANRFNEDEDDEEAVMKGPGGSGAGGGENFEYKSYAEPVRMVQDFEAGPLDTYEPFANSEDISVALPQAPWILRQKGSLGAAVAGFTTASKLRQVTVHTVQSGLRIHYTPAYFINWSNVFGSPTFPVAGWLQAGRYKFGAMDGSGNFKFDNANFDFPPLTSASLVLK